MDVAANVFLLAVVHGFMASELASNLKVLAGFVGHQSGFFGNVGANDWRNLRNGGAIDMEAAGGPAALDKGKHDVLMAPASLGFWLAFKAADESFVSLNGFASAAQWLHADNAHRLANTMRHEPSGLQGNAQGPVKLVAADTLFAGAKKVHGLQPKPHRDVTILEYGSDLHGEGLAALIALVDAYTGALALQLADAIGAAAVWANRAVRPHAGFNPSVSCGFVLEGFGLDDRFLHGRRFPL
jgi:hypothetical protein